MYLHVGWDEVLKANDIVSICDIDCWQSCQENRDLLREADDAGNVRRIQMKEDGEYREIRSVIICRDEILLSPITTVTLQHRANVMARANKPRRRLP